MGGDNFCVIFEENDDVINLIRKRISGIVNGYRGMILQGHIMVHIRLQNRRISGQIQAEMRLSADLSTWLMFLQKRK
jgi:hypothetical protein